MTREDELRVLWDKIMQCPLEQQEEIVNSLDAQDIIDMRSLRNPYKLPVYTGGKVQNLAFSYMNMREKYYERLAMTSLIGFVYRMLDEYEPEEAEKLPSENDPKFTNIYYEKIRIFERDVPMQRWKARLEEIEKDSEEAYNISTDVQKHKLFYLRNQKEHLEIAYEKNNNLHIAAENNIKNLHKNIKLAEEGILKRKKELEKIKTKIGKTSGVLDEHQEDLKKLELGFEKAVLDENAKIADGFKKIAERETELADLQTKLDESKALFDAKTKECNQHQIRLEMTIDNMVAKQWDPTKAAMVYRKYELTDEEYDTIAAEVKAELNIETTAEEYTEEYRSKIQKFFDSHFKYNPDLHVRSSYFPNYADPSRTKLTKNEPTPERSIIPPEDTFYRWKRYHESHYEMLRQATDDIYCEKPDIEFVIAPLEYFGGASEEDNDKEYNEFKLRYTDEFESEVFNVSFGKWSLIGPFSKNREKIDFYNKNTEVIKRIIDKNKEDARMGKSMMKKRVKNKKDKNDKDNEVAGEDSSAGFETYREVVGNKGDSAYGAITADSITEDMIPRDDLDAREDEVEVKVNILKTTGRGRRVRGKLEEFKFNIPADAPNSDAINVIGPTEYRKKIDIQSVSSSIKTG